MSIRIGPEGAQAIGNSESLKEPHQLGSEEQSHRHRKGAQAIANSESLKNLTSLDLRNIHIGTEGENAIKKRYPLAVFFLGRIIKTK